LLREWTLAPAASVCNHNAIVAKIALTNISAVRRGDVALGPPLASAQGKEALAWRKAIFLA